MEGSWAHVDFLQDMKYLENDMHTLKTLRHRRIVVYHDIKRDHSNINIFMEYMSGVSLCIYYVIMCTITVKLVPYITTQTSYYITVSVGVGVMIIRYMHAMANTVTDQVNLVGSL